VPSGIVEWLNTWATTLGQIGLALTGLMAVIGGVTYVFSFYANRRDAIRLRQEQWRISYRNLNISHEHVATHTANTPANLLQGALVTGTGESGELPLARVLQAESPLTQFLIFRLNIENIGDGPVDIWACLVAARELNPGDHRESWGGNVEWNDLDPYYFDTKVPEYQALAGISNTRHCVYSQDDYLQLDPHEKDTVTRIDRIEPVTNYRTLLYRAFLVGRGYGGIRGKGDGQVRDILAWQRLQQAMFNISGPSFRILFDEDDPLDRVADRDGWQCFMLYHMAFIDDARNSKGWTHIDELNAKLEGWWGRVHTEEQALALCHQELAAERERWKRHWEAFKQAVEETKRQPDGFLGLLRTSWRPQVEGAAFPGVDLTRLTAREAFRMLPAYLRWDPDDDDSMPVWEKFFVVTVRPEGDTHALHTAVHEHAQHRLP
jgi:hypothetical protein